MTTSSYMLHTRKARIFLLAPQIFQSLVLDRYLVVLSPYVMSCWM